MIGRIVRRIEYWKGILNRKAALDTLCKGHQVTLCNWSTPFPQDMWLVDFIEKRGLLAGKPDARITLYSIFAPIWLSRFDRADLRLFVERENLHKPSMQGWLHRFLDDDRIALSLGFDELDHPQYMHFPFWVMWSVFSPTATYDDIKGQIKLFNSPENHSYHNRKYCAYVCSHDDIGRRQIYEQFCSIDKVDCDGKLFHNNDELKTRFGDDKSLYLKNYRFNLTPENTNYDGYVTEKLFEAISSGCIPIYHGSDNHPEPDVLNQDAIIFIEMGKDNSAAVERVRELNADEKKYLDFANQPRFVPGAAEVIWNYYERLEYKLKELISDI